MEELLEQVHILLEAAPEETRAFILGGDFDASILGITNKHALTVDEAVKVKNIALLTLLGAIPTDEVASALIQDVPLSGIAFEKLLRDIDSSVFEKVRISLFGEKHEEGRVVKKITLGNEEGREALREQIMMNAESALKVSPIKGYVPPQNKTLEVKQAGQEPAKKESSITPSGSRSELLERLNILDTIPTNEEIQERLTNIRSKIIQVEQVKKQREEQASTTPAIVNDKKDEKPKLVFPTRYSVDPYREPTE